MTLVMFALMVLICTKLITYSLRRKCAERIREDSNVISNSKGGSE